MPQLFSEVTFYQILVLLMSVGVSGIRGREGEVPWHSEFRREK